jgi:hypothetical protein
MQDTTTNRDDATKQLAIRLPVSLIDRLERHTLRLRRASPGVDVRRADAVRALLIDALDYAEAQEREAQAKAK